MARSELERLEGGVHVSRPGVVLQRLLVVSLLVQIVGVISVVASVVVGAVLIHDSIARIDLEYIQAIVESALRSTINIEDLTNQAKTIATSVQQSVSTVVTVVNNSAVVIDSLNTLLKHPRIELSG